MNDTQIKQGSGSYTANLLGNIRSHLAGLQGYDVMALEYSDNEELNQRIWQTPKGTPVMEEDIWEQ